MKLLIDIPTDKYNSIVFNDVDKLRECVKNGKVIEEWCDNDCEHCDWVTCPKMEEQPIGQRINDETIRKLETLNMRDATTEERISVKDYIRSISRVTGVSFYDYLSKDRKTKLYDETCHAIFDNVMGGKYYKAFNHGVDCALRRLEKAMKDIPEPNSYDIIRALKSVRMVRDGDYAWMIDKVIKELEEKPIYAKGITKMTKTYCDRCGEEFDKWNQNRIFKIEAVDHKGGWWSELDICDKCRESIEATIDKFINEAKEDKE